MSFSSKHSDLAVAPPERTAYEQYGQAMRLARKLIAQTLSFFADREADAVERMRAHVINLVDARPPLTRAQNLRSIHLLLGKFSSQFGQAVQAALAEELSTALSLALPDPRKLSKRGAATDDANEGLSLSLVDIDDVERILLLDRVAQRFCSRYEAGLEPLSQRLSALFGKETMSGADNPFHPLVLLRSFVRAWEQADLDAQATEDFATALEPFSFLDLAPLYDELNATLAKAGLSSERNLVIRRAEGGAAQGGNGGVSASRPAPLEDAPDSEGRYVRQSAPTPLQAGDARSAWGALEPARRTVAAHARQFLQRIGFRPSQTDEDADSEFATRPVFEAADPALMGFLGHLQAGAGSAPSHPMSDWHDPANPNVLRQMRDSEEIRSAPEIDRGTVDALAEVFDFVFADHAIPLQMKVIIGRLQVPVLKAAMIDRDGDGNP
ncbi:MAG: hypothetical protein CFE44_20980, partial [Burkholderiales bacterium PBB4]